MDWKVADFLHECGQLRWQNPPAYLVTPVQGDRQVQEADIPELSADEFESMLASSEYDFYSASEGLDVDLDHLTMSGCAFYPPFYAIFATLVDDFSP
jgi:hypothetical protein